MYYNSNEHGEATAAAAAKDHVDAASVDLAEDDAAGETVADDLKGLTSEQHTELLAKWGPNEIPEDIEPCWLAFAKKFWGPMPIMIWVAILLEGINEEWVDFVVLFLMQLLNGLVGFIEERNAGNAIAALKNTLRPQCRVQRDGEWKIQDARDLVPGDLISLKLGDVVPADGMVVETESIDVDQSALTGESLPVTVFTEGKVVMGSSVKRGMALVRVKATGPNTFFGKAAALMGGSAPESRFQKVLYMITLFLMILSLIACAIIFVDLVVSTSGNDIMHSLSVVVIILIASIPLATQVVATSTMAVGARLMAKKKAIVARLGAIEELAGMTVLCSDKTGTLTKNILSLREPVLMADVTEKDITLMGALASHWEEGTQDAIDICILGALKAFDMLDFMHTHKQLKLVPFNPTDKRASALIEGADGRRFKVVKGAPQVVLRLSRNAPEIADEVSMAIQSLADRGFRALGVAVADVPAGAPLPAQVEEPTDEWTMLGLLAMFDPPRDDSKQTIATALAMGVEVKMVTGDHLVIAKETCRELGMGANILGVDHLTHPSSSLDELILQAHGFAEVMPEHKYQIVQSIQKFDRVVGMTGDGVNDAPALKRANIGIAVQGATDAAKAAADIVLIEPGLSVVIDAIIVSRKIFQRMRNYCMYRISATIQLLFFFFFSMLFIRPQKLAPGFEQEYFALPVIALVLIIVLNDITMITIAYDKVYADKEPQGWNLSEVAVVSSILGFIPCLSSLILLVFAVLAHESNDNPLWYSTALGSRLLPSGNYGLSTGEVLCVIYIKVAIADFLTLFCARTNWFVFERRIGKALLVAFICATAASTALAMAWPFVAAAGEQGMESIDVKTAAVVWAYNLIWMVFQDIGKVLGYMAMRSVKARFGKGQPDAIATSAASNVLTEAERQARVAAGAGGSSSFSKGKSFNRMGSTTRMHSKSQLGGVQTTDDLAIQVMSLERQLALMQSQYTALQASMAELQAFMHSQQSGAAAAAAAPAPAPAPAAPVTGAEAKSL